MLALSATKGGLCMTMQPLSSTRSALMAEVHIALVHIGVKLHPPEPMKILVMMCQAEACIVDCPRFVVVSPSK
jgi:hypothetical protein